MAEVLTCPHGHKWPAPDQGSEAADRPPACPICSGIDETPPPLGTPVDCGTTAAPRPPQWVSDVVPVSGAPPQSPAELPAIAGYDVQGLLGRGGMGVVFKARQRNLNRLVAIKMVRFWPHLDPEIVTRLEQEARMAAALQHPNIVHIYDVGSTGGGPYFVMEYIEGETLGAKLLKGQWSLPQSVALLETVARAIHYAHQRGIVHRDLKPDNILITAEGMPKVTDFGLAKYLVQDHTLTQPGAVLGTPAYMAPEQRRGESNTAGVAADVFSLGAILFHVLVGRRPPADGGEKRSELHRWLCGQGQASDGGRAAAALVAICEKCLAEEPAERYPSALEFAAALCRWQQAEASQVLAPGRLPRIARRQRLLAASVLGLLAAAGLAAAVVLRSGLPPVTATSPLLISSTPLAVQVSRDESFHPLASCVPLVSGEEIEARARVPEGIFASLFLLSSEGRLRKLAEITGGAAGRELRYPPAGKSIELIGPPGTELFFVCGNRAACPAEEDVRPLLDDSPPWPAVPPLTVLRLQPEAVEVLQESRDVSQPRDNPRTAQRDVGVLLESLRQRLRERFGYIEGLAFAHAE